MHSKSPIVVAAIAALVMSTGCFRHGEAPHRPATAKDMASAIAQSESVERIILTSYEGETLPAELAKMPNLKILIMQNAKVADYSLLPSLANLETLDLGGATLGNAAAQFSAMKSLKQLYLADCGLTEFPALPASLEYANLDRNKISEIPGTLPAGLKWLRLNSNKLAALPDSIGGMASLKRIYVRDNDISSLPDSMASLDSLEDVEAAGNKFTSFPTVLLKLKSIRNIDLSGSSISALPEDEAIAGMATLRTLTLTRCGVKPADRDRVRKALPKCVFSF